MKKGIVLLITLFFITAISLLVLKNLSDTDEFLENDNLISNNTQVLIGVKNTQKEVSKLLVKYKDDVNEALENELLSSTIPISIEELDIKFSIKKSEKIDINKMKKEDSKVVENLFLENDIFDYTYFKEIYTQKLQEGLARVDTSKQVDDIISTFIKETENKKIEDIRDYLGFIDKENLYELNVFVNFLKSSARAYYLLDEEGKVQYFDISFK